MNLAASVPTVSDVPLPDLLSAQVRGSGGRHLAFDIQGKVSSGNPRFESN